MNVTAPHGTLAAYRQLCRCQDCRRVNADKSRETRRRKRGGGPPPEDSGRRIYLDEICDFLGWGVSIDDIAARLGVKVASIERVAHRRGDEHQRATIRRSLAQHGRHRQARKDAA